MRFCQYHAVISNKLPAYSFPIHSISFHSFDFMFNSNYFSLLTRLFNALQFNMRNEENKKTTRMIMVLNCKIQLFFRCKKRKQVKYDLLHPQKKFSLYVSASEVGEVESQKNSFVKMLFIEDFTETDPKLSPFSRKNCKYGSTW